MILSVFDGGDLAYHLSGHSFEQLSAKRIEEDLPFAQLDA